MKFLSAISILSVFSLCFISSFPTSKWRFLCPDGTPTLIHDPDQEFINGAVARKQETNISHILFGISGSSQTWRRRRHYCELWWKPNVTRGFVWLDEQPREPWPETSPPYKVSADTARFKYTCWYGSRSAVRIARIVKESFELGFENVRWFVMGDDDTVFFTQNLMNVLNKYDHNRMYYIGGVSESVDQDVVHSYTMAYGGGGFAISRPLAAELVRILDSCIDRYSAFYGSDQKIGGCMSEIGVPLTRELGFHQMDIRGSPYGLLSAHPLAPLVSLHHLDYLQPLFPDTNRVASIKKLIGAYESDPSRVLQHTFCYDLTRNWSISVSWGYNVQLYPFMLSANELNTPPQTFLTWLWRRGPFTFNTRVMSLNPCERPLVFHYDRIDGLTSTMYTRSQPRYKRTCNMESYKAAYLVRGFNVSAGLLDPQFWNQAPRRQSCQIMSGWAEQDDVVQVRIRG
ncbi:glycosyltransferase [Perilla frutescens var. hirtella]|nr:glycosyltransferase [Perilla frutescens var. hirtella]